MRSRGVFGTLSIRCRFLRKQFTGLTFSQKVPFQMFDRVLNTPLVFVVKLLHDNYCNVQFCNIAFTYSISPFSANFTKWSNTFKQFVGNLLMNCLNVFNHFMGLALKGLI